MPSRTLPDACPSCGRLFDGDDAVIEADAIVEVRSDGSCEPVSFECRCSACGARSALAAPPDIACALAARLPEAAAVRGVACPSCGSAVGVELLVSFEAAAYALSVVYAPELADVAVCRVCGQRFFW